MFLFFLADFCFFFFKQKTAYEISACLVGSEMCIRDRYYINNQKSGLEVYISGATQKYVTVTGNAIGARGIMERGGQLQKVLDKYMPRRKPDEARGKHGQTSFILSDDEVLKIAAGASNGSAFM